MIGIPRHRVARSFTAALAGVVAGLGLVVAPGVGTPGVSVPSVTVTAQATTAGAVAPGWTAAVAHHPQMVALRWSGDPAARYAIETRDGAGPWRRVTTVGFDEDHRPDPETAEARRAITQPATEPVWVGNAERSRVRLVAGSPRQVTIEAVDAPAAGAADDVAGAATLQYPGIITRQQWGADENLRLTNCPEPPDTSVNAKVAVVHHTAGSNSYGPGDTASIVRGLYGYATQTLDYCDTHYNFFIDRYGQIFEGRYGSILDPVRAAHATGMNTGSVGVALIGNFASTGVPAASVDALQRLLAWKLAWHGVDPRRAVDYTTISGTDRWPAGSTHTLPFIVGHRDPGITGCPGENLYRLLPSIRANVMWRILGGGADTVANHNISPGAARVAFASADGTVFPAGGAPEFRSAAVWPHRDIVRDVELRRAGGGYTLDLFGGMHPFGGAPARSGPYWPGWDIARDLVLRSGGGGWVLDAFGGVHPFGGAPSLGSGPYWPGWDVARKLVKFTGGWYVLDGFGGLHPLGNAPKVSGPYWPGADVARDVRPNPDGPGGYLLDAFGGVWRVGGAPALDRTPYFGRDAAKALIMLGDGQGYVVREDGYLARFGGAPGLSRGRNTWRRADAITTPWQIVGAAGLPGATPG